MDKNMEDLRRVLTDHAARYPLMTPVDAVKLIYQNEFGGGHLIANEEAFFLRLRQEYAAVPKNPEGLLWEDIGGGLVRVYLGALPEAALEPLGKAFLRSAAAHRGTRGAFLDKLELLRQLAREDCFSFSAGELEAYLEEYARAGFPMVSHSDRYRTAYAPSYRIVQKP